MTKETLWEVTTETVFYLENIETKEEADKKAEEWKKPNVFIELTEESRKIVRGRIKSIKTVIPKHTRITNF